jgi:hypothetical protein
MGKSAKDLVASAYRKLQAEQVEAEGEAAIANLARWERFKEFYRKARNLMIELEIPLNDDREFTQLLSQEEPPEQGFKEFVIEVWVTPPGIFYKSRLSQGVCLSVVITGDIQGWSKPEDETVYYYRVAAVGALTGTLQAEVTELELIPQALQKICAQALIDESNAMRKQP